MTSINPTADEIAALRAEPPDTGPIVMINLLRYRDRAEYPADSGHAPCTGREAYERYAALAFEEVVAVGGHLRWAGAVAQTVIGPASERWDDALLVEYPTIGAFLGMISKPSYQAAAVHRTAALDDSRLIRTAGLERGR